MHHGNRLAGYIANIMGLVQSGAPRSEIMDMGEQACNAIADWRIAQGEEP